MVMPRNANAGFTLVELLIALSIMGMVSAFAVPLVIGAQQAVKLNAIGKESASMVSAAYMQYLLSYNMGSGVTGGAFTPYMNYASIDTTSTSALDDSPAYGARDCTASNPCLRMHNGSIIQYEGTYNFGGTGSGQALFFFVDPDGSYSGTTWGTAGNGKALRIALKYSGRVTSMGASEVTLCNSSYCLGAGSGWDPSWFSWSP